MRKTVVVALLQLVMFHLFAQNTVKGSVVDETGQPLPGASVTFNSEGQSTTADGQFLFKNSTKKTGVLRISFIGYKTYEQTVTPPFDKKIMLQKADNELNEVTVSSLMATDKSPVAYTNISKESLSKTNFGQDVPYLLSLTPSFVVTSDAGTGIGYTGFRIRGTDASRINVTINGIPYNDPDEQSTYWVDVPDIVSSTGKMQIQRGVGTSTNGAGAFGANINLQTDNLSPKAGAGASLTYGSFNTKKATVKASTGIIDNHWSVDTRLSSIASSGYIDRAWVKMNSYFVQAGYAAENTTFKFLTFGGTEKTYHAWDGVPKDSLATHRTYNPCGFMGFDANGKPLYYQNQTDNYTQTNYQLLGTHTFSGNFTLNAGLHYTKGDGYYEEYQQNQPLTYYSLSPFSYNGATADESDLVTQKRMANDFAGGVFSINYQKNKLLTQLGGAFNCYWGDQWGDVIWVKNYTGDMLPVTEYYRNHVNKKDGNIYLKINYEALNGLNVYADLQYRKVFYYLNGKNDQWDDAISAMQSLDIDRQFNFFNPKVGGVYTFNKKNALFASFAVAHREPTRTNYTDGDPQDRPTYETLYDCEAGYKFQTDGVSFGANLYYMYYRNQLILTGEINDMGEVLTKNIPQSYRAGIELVGAVKPAKWLRWDANLTLSRNRIHNFTEYVDVYTGDAWTGQQANHLGNVPIAFSPAITANSMFTVTKRHFEAALQTQYIGKQYIDNTGSDLRSLAGYCLNNLRFSYTFSPLSSRKEAGGEVAFTLLLNNIFNTQYISNAWVYSSYYQDNQATPLVRNDDFGFFPQAGFNCLMAVTVRF